MRNGLAVALPFVLLGCRSEPLPAPGNDRVVAIYVESVGLMTPRAIVYDSLADMYLVSNAPTSTPTGGQGFVSRVSPRGKIVNLRWLAEETDAQLDAPAGMAIRGDTLFVADVKCVRLFDRVHGRPIGQFCPGGAHSLSGVAVSDSVLYVTDTANESDEGIGLASVHLASTGSSARGQTAIYRPGGVVTGPWGVFVTTHGVDQVVQLTSAAPRTVIRGVEKELGGVVATRSGSFAFSNATDSTVLFVEVAFREGTGAIWTLARGVSQPGHLGYDSRRNRVLIPEAGRDRLILVDLLQ